jgi:hypothetical protein
MVPFTDDDAVARTEVARLVDEASSSTRQAAEAKLARRTAEATCLATDTAHARHEADHTRCALTGAGQDQSPS